MNNPKHVEEEEASDGQDVTIERAELTEGVISADKVTSIPDLRQFRMGGGSVADANAATATTTQATRVAFAANFNGSLTTTTTDLNNHHNAVVHHQRNHSNSSPSTTNHHNLHYVSNNNSNNKNKNNSHRDQRGRLQRCEDEDDDNDDEFLGYDRADEEVVEGEDGDSMRSEEEEYINIRNNNNSKSNNNTNSSGVTLTAVAAAVAPKESQLRAPHPTSYNVVVSQPPPTPVSVALAANPIIYTISSTSTSSAASSVSSSLSTSPALVLDDEEQHLQPQQQYHHHHHEPLETRKVEPLRINLNREPIRTVIKLGESGSAMSPATVVQTTATPSSSSAQPKITFKPILPPKLEESMEKGSSGVDSIPKLHIRMNHSGVNESLENHHHHQQQQPEMVIPKLLIRNSGGANNIATATTSGSGAESVAATTNLVPKLTLKMVHSYNNNNIGSASSGGPGHASESHHSSIVKITDEGTKVKIKKLIEPPLPKLTIKGTNVIEEQIMLQPSSISHLTVPKLTIKVPNCTAAAGGGGSTGDVPTQSTEDSDNVVVVAAVAESSFIPKLTLKSIGKTGDGQRATESFQILQPGGSSSEQLPSPIPKLKVRFRKYIIHTDPDQSVKLGLLLGC